MGRSKNLSVSQFQDLMANIPKEMAGELREAVFENAEMLSNAQRSAVAVDDGAYRDSHRVEEGSHPLKALVKAGGEKTTRPVRAGASVNYDYANANEFGTQDMPARPSFWPTYRLMKKRVRSSVARRVNKVMRKYTGT